MISHRSSGILAHITSLPSPYGIGDLGPSSYNFLAFLDESEQSYWQFLPTSPTNPFFDNSPYMSNSAFAGNPLLISPELLYQEGFLTKEDLETNYTFNPYITEFTKVFEFKTRLLEKAFLQFDKRGNALYSSFIAHSKWLKDYALFMVAKEVYGDCAWCDWPDPLAVRNEEALIALESNHQSKMEYYYFEQFIYFNQWQKLREKAAAHSILLFGDLPIYVSYDSVDVWANQTIFLLDRKTRRPTHVSGVPPDYFSDTGQRWGNPLYDWQSSSTNALEQLTDWWKKRFSHLFSQVDLARIDHFRGFESYWSIPEEEETAVKGKWLKGPGFAFFEQMKQQLGVLPIVAEDLGIITQEVGRLRDRLNFPGMKVLQFAFDGNLDNDFLPYNFTHPECVVYTGTHDNDTTVGWFLSEKMTDNLRADIKTLANRNIHDNAEIHKDLMYLAQSSIAKLCIFPLQDVLGFGNDCKMNSPGVPTGNWRWRCDKRFLTQEVELFLKNSTQRFGRSRPSQQNVDIT